MKENEMFKKMYLKISPNISNILLNYVHDKETSLDAGMVLMILSLKMLMFGGLQKKDIKNVYKILEETFDVVLKDFKIVDQKVQEKLRGVK